MLFRVRPDAAITSPHGTKSLVNNVVYSYKSVVYLCNGYTPHRISTYPSCPASPMPRVPGPINNEFVTTETEGKSPVVLCKHCRVHKVAKASNKRKAAHLKRCEAYLRAQSSADPALSPVHDVNAVVKQTIIVAKPYWYPHDASLKPETTALVIIDMQRDCE